LPTDISIIGGTRHPICQPREHLSQINIVATLETCPHNIHLRPIGTIVKDGPFGHLHWEDDMVHNCAHGPSMFDHLDLPTTTFQKVKPSTNVE
jgi:hypothetical protein